MNNFKKSICVLMRVFTLVIFCAWTGAAFAATEIEIIFDASNSMNDSSGTVSKLDAAKQALTTIADQIDSSSNVGMRVFGTTPVQGNIRETCVDSKLTLPIGPFNKNAMVAGVLGLKAYGQTPIGFSLLQAAKDFSPSPDVKKTIILISDGGESCGQDPAGVVEQLKAQGIDLVIHTVGFDVDDAARGQLKRLSEMTGGTYADAANADELKAGLEAIGEQSMLLVPKKDAKKSLLAATEGARVVSSTKPGLAALIDGKEDAITEAIWKGDSIVFAFKDNQPVLLEAVAIPITEQYRYNPSSLELWGSVTTSDAGAFSPITKVAVKNEVQFGNVYQELPLASPAAVRYLKVIFGTGMSGDQSYPKELKAYGKYLSEEEFSGQLEDAAKKEINLLGAVNGGKFIAGSRPEFANLIDGALDNPGNKLTSYGNEEGIFGFRDNKTVIISKISIPVFEASGYNTKTIEIMGSTTSPTSGYEALGKFETMNMVFAGNPYQEYVFDPPVRVRYLKIKLIDAHGGGHMVTPEIRAYGTYE